MDENFFTKGNRTGLKRKIIIGSLLIIFFSVGMNCLLIFSFMRLLERI